MRWHMRLYIHTNTHNHWPCRKLIDDDIGCWRPILNDGRETRETKIPPMEWNDDALCCVIFTLFRTKWMNEQTNEWKKDRENPKQPAHKRRFEKKKKHENKLVHYSLAFIMLISYFQLSICRQRWSSSTWWGWRTHKLPLCNLFNSE